jgi:hypothetical protein
METSCHPAILIQHIIGRNKDDLNPLIFCAELVYYAKPETKYFTPQFIGILLFVQRPHPTGREHLQFKT